MKRLVLLFYRICGNSALQRSNPNETRVVKDAAGRVKYTVHKTGNREIIKDSKGRITGTTRETKERKYYYNSNGSSAGTETNGNRQADSGKVIIRQVLNRMTGSNWIRECHFHPERL